MAQEGTSGGVERRMLFADGLRGIAAMWVVLFHLAEGHHVDALRAVLPRWLNTGLFSWGHGGVGIFFVLSGFVMAMTVQRAPMDGPGAGRFVLRRLVRLCPPYWLALALYAVMTFAKGGSVLTGQLLANVFLAQGMLGFDNINVVFWTLCIEIQFYITFAAMTWASDRVLPAGGRTIPRVFIALLALAWPVGMLMNPVWRGGFLPFWVFFMAGVLAFEGSRSRRGMCAGALAFGAALFGLGLMRGDLFSGVAGLTCIALVASSLGNGMQAWLSARPLQLVGIVSYSLYLFHNAVTGIGFRILDKVAAHRGPVADVVCSTAVIGACLVAAWMAWFTVERASIALSRRVGASTAVIPVTELPAAAA